MPAPRPQPSKARTDEGSPLEQVPVRAIHVPETRLRSLDPDWAAVLAEMFRDSGQSTPIDLVAEGKGFVLVTGLHRLEAARQLKWTTIAARVLSPDSAADTLRQHEILDNLARKDLNALERCAALAELKAVYERLYPQS